MNQINYLAILHALELQMANHLNIRLNTIKYLLNLSSTNRTSLINKIPLKDSKKRLHV